MKSRHIHYLLVALGIITLLMLWFRGVDADGPSFMLAPIAGLIELITGSQAVFEPEVGYYFPSLHIIINKSCSGFNFCCICFFLLCFVASGYLAGRRKAIFVAVPVALLASYGLTIIVNTSRILLAMMINTGLTSAGKKIPDWLHVGEGIFIYLLFLILIYMLADFVCKKYFW